MKVSAMSLIQFHQQILRCLFHFSERDEVCLTFLVGFMILASTTIEKTKKRTITILFLRMEPMVILSGTVSFGSDELSEDLRQSLLDLLNELNDFCDICDLIDLNDLGVLTYYDFILFCDDFGLKFSPLWLLKLLARLTCRKLLFFLFAYLLEVYDIFL
jgi:hypothetical protein